MFIRFFAWCLLLGVSLLMACGGGGSDGESPDGGSSPPGQVLEGDYLPAPTAALWTYAASDNTTLTIKVVDERQTAEGRIATLENRWSDIPESFRSQTLRTADDVRELGSQSSDAFDRALGDYSIVRLPLTVGSEFVQLDKTIEAGIDIDGDQISDRYSMRTVVRVAGVENITTLVGQYSAVRIRSVANRSYQSSVQRREVKGVFTIDEWYVRDVGLVRYETTLDRDDGSQSKFSYWITAFRVGDKRSESQAPTIVSSWPATESIVGNVISAVIQFSESIEPSSANERTVRLLDSLGQALPLTRVQAGDTQLYIELVDGLTIGRYTIQINGVTDLVGNPLVQSVSFEVDTTAPSVVRFTPSSGAVDVDPLATIAVEFSEAMDTNSGGNNRFLLFEANNSSTEIPLTFRYLTPTQVEVRPTSPLRPRQKYRFAYFGADRAGNQISGSFEFLTRPEWFGFSNRPAHVIPGRATAIGDVTGDGRNDLVVAPLGLTSPAIPFVVYPQQSNGQLGEGLPPPAGEVASCSYYWSTDSLYVMDVDGDGRRDVIAVAGCGTYAFLQDVEGRFSTVRTIIQSSSLLVRVGDVNGDGRLDALVMQPKVVGGTNGLDLRLQQPNGSFDSAITVGSNVGVFDDLAIADINGDQRMDLVFVGELAPGRSIAWMAQAGDGSFGAVQYLPVPGDANLGRVVVADLNADGLMDVAAANVRFATTSSVRTFMQRGDGTFLAHGIPVQMSTATLAALDMDSDGRLDLVTGRAGSGDVAVFRQRSDGSFSDAQLLSAFGDYGVSGFSFGDLNGDGLVDWATNRSELAYRIGDAPKLQAFSTKRVARHVGEIEVLKRRLH
jgi:Bacterial Ig-like domain/FG-GAP-like repeat